MTALAARMKHSFSAFGWPFVALLAVGAIGAAQYFGVINLAALSLEGLWPRSPEFDKFASDSPSIALAFLFGAAGAFVKLSLGAGAQTDRTRQLVAGGVVGVVVFFLMKSQVIPHIMYDNLPTQGLEVSYDGLALLAVFAGMYAAQIANWASRR